MLIVVAVRVVTLLIFK